MDNNYIYLVKVEPNANNNKYYKMIQLDDNYFEVQYGRIGNSNCQKSSYSMSQWDKKMREKLKKGYIDQTRLVAEIKVDKNEVKYKEIEDISIKNIVNRLQAIAKQAIKDNYTISSSNVTQLMIDEAQLVLDKLMEDNTTDSFNKILVELFKIIPRKMSRVSEYLALNTNDFSNIIQREQDLLDVMRGQVKQQDIVNETNVKEEDIPSKTILETLGIRITSVTSDDENIIKFNLGSIADKYYQAWKVENIRTQNKYNEYIDKNNIRNIKLLFHGSRNENWWSIINNGLVLRPNAVITGKLYGHGIYFAPKAQKSLGYTLLSGSYWVRGNEKFGFMSIYEVAYGNPYNVYDFNSKYYNLNYDNLKNFSKDANCLHAHAGANLGSSNLRNDEIVIYKEEQCTIKYLVELR